MAKKCETVSILVHGSNKLVLDEADRSIHDALCVIRCLVKKRYVLNILFSLLSSIIHLCAILYIITVAIVIFTINL